MPSIEKSLVWMPQSSRLFQIDIYRFFFLGTSTPISGFGRFIGGITALFGVFTITLPVPIVVNSFSNFYKTRLWRSEVAIKRRDRLIHTNNSTKESAHIGAVQLSLFGLAPLFVAHHGIYASPVYWIFWYWGSPPYVHFGTWKKLCYMKFMLVGLYCGPLLSLIPPLACT